MKPILPDVLATGLKVVFCGTAAGAVSAKVGAYYAGPGNRFWPTLHQLGLTSYQLKPHEFPQVLNFGIGLTDLAKCTFGQDAELTKIDFDRENLHIKILKFAPKALAFNGKNAAKHFFERTVVAYGRQAESIDDTVIFVLPSTSGAARGFWDMSYWENLADFWRG